MATEEETGEVKWWEEKGELQDERVLKKRIYIVFINSQSTYNKTMPAWVDRNGSMLLSGCSWLCFPAGAHGSVLSCQSVSLADYHSHPEKLDHAVIQPIFIHRHNPRIKTHAHTVAGLLRENTSLLGDPIYHRHRRWDESSDAVHDTLCVCAYVCVVAFTDRTFVHVRGERR